MKMKHIAFFAFVISCSAHAMHHDFYAPEHTNKNPLNTSGHYVRSGCLEIYLSPSHEQALQRKIEQVKVAALESETTNQDNQVSKNSCAQSFSSAAAIIGALIVRAASCSLEEKFK